jgi:prevent-host-death family protein
MKVINVAEAKTQLSRLMEEAAAGQVILLGKHGRPMAKLCPYAPAREPRPLGGFEGRIRIADDFDDEDVRIGRMFAGDDE